MTDPYHILNVNRHATDQQIKNAYRQLAKRYHPDVSKESDAEEKFIEITEAYETIQNGTTEFEQVYETFTPAATYSREPDRRERARQYSKMKYEEFVRNNTLFKQTWYYFPVKIIIYAFVYLMYFLGAVVVIMPVFFFIFSGVEDGVVFPIFMFMFGLVWIRMIRVLQQEIKPFFDDYD